MSMSSSYLSVRPDTIDVQAGKTDFLLAWLTLYDGRTSIEEGTDADLDKGGVLWEHLHHRP
jgi:hypothetical protein